MEYVFDLDGTMYTDEYNYAWAWPPDSGHVGG